MQPKFSPEPNNPLIPDIIEPAWYKSKKLLALMVNHALVVGLGIFGIIKNPSSTGQIITGAFVEMGPVTAAHSLGQTAVDRAQAYSPVYPSGGRYPPVTPPVPPQGSTGSHIPQ